MARLKEDKIFIVIPAYNEEKTISKVIKDLKKYNYKNIIVVDDGSKDKTYEKARKEGAMVLRHFINLGQGAALRTGINFAIKQDADIIITFDADGQHQAKDIKKLIKPIENKKAEIVLGSRFLGKALNIPLHRKLFLKAGALLFRIFYGVKVTDSHMGLRALTKKAAKLIKIKSDGFEHASEIIEEIGKKRLKYLEVPVTIKYTKETLKKGQGFFAGIKIFLKMIKNRFLQ